MITKRNITIGVLFIIIDILIYIFLGIAMMDYDDFYTEDKGVYMSLESMNTFQKTIFISLNIWNIINIAIVIFIVYKVITHLKKQHNISSKKIEAQ